MNGIPPLFDPDEPILRRIPAQPGYFNLNKVPPVERGAFTPGKNDTDGLSFYLEREISAQELVDATGKPPGHFYVSRFKARDLYDLGLSIVDTRHLGDLPGHVSVPEINISDYGNAEKKPRLKELGIALAAIAARNIIIGPSQ